MKLFLVHSINLKTKKMEKWQEKEWWMDGRMIRGPKAGKSGRTCFKHAIWFEIKTNYVGNDAVHY